MAKIVVSNLVCQHPSKVLIVGPLQKTGRHLKLATAGIGQVYLERIMGMGYLDAQLKIQIHFVMLIITASIFAIGVALFIIDFFRYRPVFEVTGDTGPGLRPVKPARPARPAMA